MPYEIETAKEILSQLKAIDHGSEAEFFIRTFEENQDQISVVVSFFDRASAHVLFAVRLSSVLERQKAAFLEYADFLEEQLEKVSFFTDVIDKGKDKNYVIVSLEVKQFHLCMDIIGIRKKNNLVYLYHYFRINERMS